MWHVLEMPHRPCSGLPFPHIRVPGGGLCGHITWMAVCLCQNADLFLLHRGPSVAFVQLPLPICTHPLPCSLATTDLSSIRGPFQESFKIGIIQDGPFEADISHQVCCPRGPFTLPWAPHIGSFSSLNSIPFQDGPQLCDLSPTEGNWGHFQDSAHMWTAAMSIHVQLICACKFGFLWDKCWRVQLLGYRGAHISVVRNCQTASRVARPIPSQQWCERPATLHHRQALVLCLLAILSLLGV